jgi:VCBS repeat-containing protein
MSPRSRDLMKNLRRSRPTRANAQLNVEQLEPRAMMAADLFISEYVEGSSNNKALELFNPTEQAVNLNDYELRLFANGSSNATSTVNLGSLQATLAAGQTFVVVNGSASAALTSAITTNGANSATSGVINFNGDDALGLYKNGVIIDQFGVIGVDPGSAWVDGDRSTVDRTLRRAIGTTEGNPNGFANLNYLGEQWYALAIDTFDGLGRAPINNAAIAVNDTVSGEANQPFLISIADLLGNDFDETAAYVIRTQHGNVNVVQNDTANNASSVSLTLTGGTAEFILESSNRGDYNIRIGASRSDDLSLGIMIAHVASNGKVQPHATGTYSNVLQLGTASVAPAGGGYFVSLHLAVAGNDIEYNDDFAASFFGFDDWLGGRATNSTNNGPITSFEGSDGLRYIFVNDTPDFRFQQGVDGYTGAVDAFIDRNETRFDLDQSYIDGDATGGTSADNERHALIRFDDIIGTGAGQIALGTDIAYARLVIQTGTAGAAPSGGTFALSQLLQGFDTSTVWADFGTNGPDGAEVSPFDSLIRNPAGQVSFDVTAIMEAWLRGEANLGFDLRPESSDGWQIFLSAAADAGLRPSLEVFLKEPGEVGVIAEQGRGQHSVRLHGVNSAQDGVLLTNGYKNEDNFASTIINADGSWTIVVHDNDSQATEADPFAFVYVPSARPNIISGRVSGNADILYQSGGFTVEELTDGQMRLTIDGHSPSTGTLIVQHEAEGINFDNFLTFAPDGNGWIIQSHDMPLTPGDAGLQDVGASAMFSFVFMPFETSVVEDTFRFDSFSATSSLGATVTMDGGFLNYDPTTSAALQALRGDQSLDDTITYTIVDSAGNVSQATVTITVQGISEPPVALASLPNLFVLEDADSTQIDIAGLFSDPDTGDTLTYSVLVGNIAVLDASISGTTLTLDYLENRFGHSKVTVRATDSSGLSTDVEFLVAVESVNDDPMVNGETNVTTTDQNTAISIMLEALLANDFDVDNILITDHGNIRVVQLDTDNNSTTSANPSVILSLDGATSGFIVISGNRGDYDIQIGDDRSDDVSGGVIISSIRSNGVDHGQGQGTQSGTTALQSTGSGYYIPLFESNSGAEYNDNVAAGYFPYDIFIGGYATNSTNGGPITNFNSGGRLTMMETETVSFQSGVDGYGPMLDGVISTRGIDNFTDENFFLDGQGPTEDGIFRFDDLFGDGPGQIPLGSLITSAQLVLTTSTVSNAPTGGPYGVHQLLVPVDQTTTFVDPFGGAGPQELVHYGAEAGRFGGASAGSAVGADVTAILQAWANGEVNYGFLVRALTSDGWNVWMSESADPSFRPRLEVTYSTGGNLLDQGNGLFLLHLPGVNSQTDGVLLANGGKNEDNFALVRANTNGTWTIINKDNGDDAGGSEQDGIAFTYIPNGTTDIVSGKVDGNANKLISSGDFSVETIGTGTVRLLIDGYTPDDGVLITTPEGLGTFNVDNIITYEAEPVDPQNPTAPRGWIIQSRDIPNLGPQSVNDEPMFSFAFLPFAQQTISITSVESTSSLGASVSLSGGEIQYDPSVSSAIAALGAGQTLLDTITYTVSDNLGGASSTTVTVTVVGTNDAPVVVDSTPQSLSSITEDDIDNNGNSVIEIVGSSITDVDTGTDIGIALIGWTVDTGNGTWQFSIDGGATWSDIGVVSSSSALLLRSSDRIRFIPDTENGATGTISYHGWDASGSTAGEQGNKVAIGATGTDTPFSTGTGSAGINVTDVNDAPVLNASGNPALSSIAEDDVDNNGNSVAEIVGSAISDVDTGAVAGIAVIGATVDVGNGTWQFSTDSGATWSDLPSVSSAQALVLRLNDRLRFVPDGLNQASGSLTFHAWDQTGVTAGQEGGTVNASATGGTNPFSSVSDTATILVSDTNDAPVLDSVGGNDFTTIDEDALTNPGNSVSELVGSSITDPDLGAVEGIAVVGTSINSGTGIWQFSVNRGATWSDVGTVNLGQALLLRSEDRIRFLPDAERGTTGSVTFHAWDQTGSTAGAQGNKVGISETGGVSPFSLASDAATIVVTDVNDAVDNLQLSLQRPAVELGGTVFLSATFDDVDLAGNYVATINWGDGQTTQLDLGTSQSFANLAHQYASVANTYVISVTIFDGASVTSSVQTVVGAGLVNDPFEDGKLALFVAGSSSAVNNITLQTMVGGGVRVLQGATLFGSFDDLGTFLPDERIFIFGGENGDFVNASNVWFDVIMFGGGGNDRLTGGSGNDVLIGGAGNDLVTGGGGNDIIIGGMGRDVLSDSTANSLIRQDDDLIIAGDLPGSDNLDFLRELYRTWTNQTQSPQLGSAAERQVAVRNLASSAVNDSTVLDDQEIDTVTVYRGSQNVVWKGTGDVVQMFTAGVGTYGESTNPTDPGAKSKLVSVDGMNSGWLQFTDEQTGAVLQRIQPLPGVEGLSVAVADVTGDGVDDYIVAGGAGSRPEVAVVDGETLQVVQRFLAFTEAFRGGVSVAAGDMNDDGYAEIVVAAGAGGGPHVRVLDGRTGAELQSFFAYDAGFTGGVSVAVGDVDGNGTVDLITGAGAGGGPHVKVYGGLSGQVIRSFFAFDAAFAGGVHIAAGDVNMDGYADIIVGAGAGGGPHVRVFSGPNLTELRSFFAYDAAFAGGVEVAAGDMDGNGVADIITAAGPGGGPHVRAFSGLTGGEVASFFAAPATSTRGVQIAANPMNSADTIRLAGGLGSGSTSTISSAVLAVSTQRAIDQWIAAGLNADAASRLSQVRVQTADLSGDLLAIVGPSMITVDVDAAGHGWSTGDTLSAGGVDLVTVLGHELGHILGLADLPGVGDDLMHERLAPGVTKSDWSEELLRIRS